MLDFSVQWNSIIMLGLLLLPAGRYPKGGLWDSNCSVEKEENQKDEVTALQSYTDQISFRTNLELQTTQSKITDCCISESFHRPKAKMLLPLQLQSPMSHEADLLSSRIRLK
ncbi:hypothetical protein ACLOJK_038798 [Asimina triloba]